MKVREVKPDVDADALLAAGIDPQRLTLVERDGELAAFLRRHFPGLRIIEGDAVRLPRLLADSGVERVSVVVSSLPLLSLPAEIVKGIVEGVFQALPRGAALVQFTYGPTPPVPRALPTTTSASCSRPRQRSSAAAVRVVPSSRASSGTPGSESVQITSLPAGRRARVTPAATIPVSRSTGAPARSAATAARGKPAEALTSLRRSTIPQAWIIRTTVRESTGSSPVRSASRRIVANDRR